METKNTFTVIFYLRLNRIDEMNTAPVLMRVTVNSARFEITTSRRFDINRWENGQPTGNNGKAHDFDHPWLI